MHWYLDPLKRWSDFAGRTSRQPFWMFMLFNFIIGIVVNMVDAVLGTSFLGVLYALFILIPGIAIGVRRLHDSGKSGWLMLLGLIPVLGIFIVLFFYVLPSDGDNAYGPAPAAA